ncbi:hypothetical protein OC861_003890 [Tilletia horrida]|nr:hypothetical protein OC861_003890 [Tilletia horrida]
MSQSRPHISSSSRSSPHGAGAQPAEDVLLTGSSSLGAPEGDPSLPIVAALAEADAHSKPEDINTSSSAHKHTVDDHLKWSASKPWHQRPSDLWLRPFAFFLASILGAAMAPRAELYIQLVCHELLGDVTDPLVCRKSPHVEAASASLQLRMTLAMGILSVYTTGAWGALSDRKGRTYVLSLACCGLICTDLAFFAVTLLPPRGWHLPGGYNFLIIGSVVEGLMGGFATLIAAHQAYIADTTPSGTRAKTFAIFGGCMFGGLALGPILGGFIVEFTGDILSVFYLAFLAHVVYLLFVFFILPESVSPERKAAAERERQLAQEKARAELEEQLSRDAEEDAEEERLPVSMRTRRKTAFKRIRSILAYVGAVTLRQLTRPLAPMAMLLPKRYPAHDQQGLHHRESSASLGGDASASSSHISVSRLTPRRSLERNLFLLSVAYFVESMIMGILPSKVQYAILLFGWGPKELGEYMSFASVSRVIALMLILPMAIRHWHRPDKAVQKSEAEDRRRSEAWLEENAPNFADHGGRSGSQAAYSDEPRPEAEFDASDGSDPMLSPPRTPRSRTVHFSEENDEHFHDPMPPEMARSGSFQAPTATEDELWSLRIRHLRLIHDSAFDLRLGRVSVMVGVAAYLLLTFSRTPFIYLLSTAVTSLGGGGNAAMSSLALAFLHNPADAGKLFSAWSVLSAIATSVLGPLMFSNLFVSTVDRFPAAIFILGVVLYIICLILLSFVKVRAPHSLPVLPPQRKRHAPAGTDNERPASSITLQ